MSVNTLTYETLCKSIIMMKDANAVNKIPSPEERQAILLLDKASSCPDAPTVFIAYVHKLFADVYYLRNFFGSALQHYELAVKFDPALPIKDTISDLKKIPKNRLTYSTDTNISEESD